MSAFVMNKVEIDAIILAGLNIKQHANDDFCYFFKRGDEQPWRVLTRETADAIGQVLVNENVRSVMGRYNEDKPTNLPGPTNAYWLIPYKLGETRIPTVVQAIKLVNCYEYQACESNDWKKTEAHAFCDYLKGHLIHCLPGYEDAPWGWPPPKTTKPKVRSL